MALGSRCKFYPVPAQNPRPKMLGSLGVKWTFLLGLLLGVIEPIESYSSYMGICQGYPDIRKEPQGLIRSPSVQEMSYSSCSWVILGGPEDVIYIRFQHFSLSCNSEMLIVRSSFQPPWKICGSKNPEPLRIKGGNVTLTYSWKFLTGDGFQLKYQRESKTWPAYPCNLTLDNFYGVLFSPGFASDSYLGVASCQWALDAHDSRPLSIRFTLLELDIGDSLRVYEGVPGTTLHPHLLRNLDYTSNNKVVTVDSPSSRAWVTYQAAGTTYRGFNATYHVRGFCVPWDFPCGGGDGEGATCYSAAERCDGTWDCANGADEEGCRGCPLGQYACGGQGMGGAVCYGLADRCNYQTFCADAADERHCYSCQPGNFRCHDGRCIYESWMCDGQADCIDASDEADCTYVLPRKVVTAAVIGSLVCGLLLVIALGCTCRLYSLRNHEFGVLTPMSRMEAQLVQRQAPPSYGQLIARGVIPPVDGFPTEHPNQNSMLGNLRSLLHLLRRDPTTTSPAAANGSRHSHRNRFLRRVVRRMRRMGLLPQPAPSSSTTTTTTSSSHSVPENPSEPLSGAEISGQPDEQAPPLPQKVLPLPAEPAPEPQVPHPPTPRLSGMMHTLRVRLFSPMPPCSEEGRDPLSIPPSPVDEDDVLLVPLTEPWLETINTTANWDADDEPLLT
ncbi:low-density lipoprotein receptor-related protein 10 isoform X2 [Sceloporus undulatus]|uniref:low-density lipoprotein receptor-related protein 10 isoform X2 n=1 Tax=Sceloporus undulatus TaxID=8520 RepID=UPI001C4BF7EC|nr:low-density lipoprotein receptor-related protein 10 isoform X2 [Sceloporus undulatus]